jgi:negative regulator of replication initiation
MKTIEIDELVFHALEKRVIGFGETPNDVIRRLLNGEDNGETAVERDARPGPGGGVKTIKHPLIELVESPEYLRQDGKGRYFNILGFLHKADPQEFEKLDNFRMGSRVQISKAQEAIERSGRSTMPQKLEGTPYWVLSNLANPRKRDILADVLRVLRYPKEVIAAAVGSIPDSGISRKRGGDYYP